MTGTMSYNRAFSQPAFWAFVADMKTRETKNPNTPAATKQRPSWGTPRRNGMGGRRRQNRDVPVATEPTTVTMFDATAPTNERDMPPSYPAVPETVVNEKTTTETTPLMRGRKGGAAAGFPKLRARLQEKGLSEEEITNRIEKRQARRAALGKGNGKGQGKPRGPAALAERLREKGLSEEEIAARIEKRRARRAQKALANTELKAVDPIPEPDEPCTRGPMCKRGPGNCKGRRHYAKNLRQAKMAGMPAVAPEMTEKATTADRVDVGPNAPVHLSAITKGGPAKFAGRFNKTKQEGAILSHGNVEEVNSSECPSCGTKARNHRALRSGVRNLNINDTETSGESGNEDLMNKRHLRKVNKQNGPRKFKGKGGNKKNAKVDIFATGGSFVVHLPVPGVKQEDVAVTWDAEKSAVLVAGVIRRPALLEIGHDATLVRGQRAVGPFQRKIKLGKKGDVVRVYENGITAIVDNGILIIEVPKYDGVDSNDEGYIEVNEKVYNEKV